jgi:hypothetical protein
MERERIIKIWDTIVLVTAAIGCVIIMLLGLLDWNKIITLPITIDYAFVSCVLLGAIAIHFALSIYGNFGQKEVEHKIDESTRKIIDSLVGVEKQTFNSMNAVDEYVTKRIKEATSRVYDLNWLVSDKPSNRDVEKDRLTRFHKNLNNGITHFNNNKKTDFYREIFVFHYPLKVDVMKSRLNFEKYSCKYYHKNNKFPKLQFVIIDDEEVIFISSLYKNGQLCAIRDKIIVALFIHYFDYSWKNALLIREDGKTENEVVAEIESSFSHAKISN